MTSDGRLVRIIDPHGVLLKKDANSNDCTVSAATEGNGTPVDPVL